MEILYFLLRIHVDVYLTVTSVAVFFHFGRTTNGLVTLFVSGGGIYVGSGSKKSRESRILSLSKKCAPSCGICREEQTVVFI